MEKLLSSGSNMGEKVAGRWLLEYEVAMDREEWRVAGLGGSRVGGGWPGGFLDRERSQGREWRRAMGRGG